jgi:hypothetical protein
MKKNVLTLILWIVALAFTTIGHGQELYTGPILAPE